MNKKFFLLGLVAFFALPTMVFAFSCAPLMRAFNYALHDKHMLRSCTTGRFLPVAGHFEGLKIVRDRIMFNIQSTMASKAIMQQNNEMARLVGLSLKQHALEGTAAKSVAQAPSRALSSGVQEILARIGFVGLGVGTGTALGQVETVSKVTPELIEVSGVSIATTFTSALSVSVKHGAKATQDAVVNASQMFGVQTSSKVTPQLIEASGVPIITNFTDGLNVPVEHGAKAAQDAVVNASQIFGGQASNASSSLSKIVTDTFTHHSYAICGGAILTGYLGYCWHKKVSPITHVKRALAGLFYNYTPSRLGEGCN